MQAGYNVREAGSGLEALNLIASARPALVLLNANLPDLNGLEVCRRIKAGGLISNTPVLQIFAASITPADRSGVLDNCVDAYLIEPIDGEVLLGTIRALLRMRKAEEESERAKSALEQANNTLEQLNASLVRSNQDLNRFAYLASHDLQEPLRTVSSFVALLERRYRGRLDASADEFIEYIRDGTERMRLLIQSLLVYAQATQDNQESWREANAAEMLGWALENLQKSIEDSKAVITYDSLPSIKGDHMQLSQLFQNLISNGLKYHRPEEPPRIDVSARKEADGQMIQFSIRDNGIGIAPENHDRIFAPFQRLHGREIPGTGIGLATCQRIAERHGGRIWVESDGYGTGSTFRFTLPAAEETSPIGTGNSATGTTFR